MKHWPTKPLGEIADLTGGSTPSRDNPAFWNGKILWATPTDLPMPDDGIATISHTKDKITQEGLDNCSAKLIPKGTVIFSSRATIGKVAVTEVPLATNQGFANFIPHSQINSRYLAYTLWSHRDDIARLSGSTTFKEVNRSTLRKYQIPVPPLSEQERIVKLLDEADALRKLRAQADQRTAALIPALFNEMFGDPATNPKSWPIKILEELFDITSSKRVFERDWKSHGVPFYRTRELVKLATYGHVDNELFISEEMYKKYSAKYGAPREGDIMVSGVGTLGICYVVKQGDKFYFKDGNIIWLKKKTEANSLFIETAFQTAFVQNQIHNNSAGATVGTYTIVRAKKTRVLLPSLELQNKFADRVEEIRKLEFAQSASRKRLDDLFQSLLHRAFQGEL